MQGQLDTNLTELGIAQAGLIGERLKNEQYDRVFTSDLKRAVDTATIIRAHSVYRQSTWYQKMVLDQNLREMKLGSIEGRNKSQISELEQ